MTQHAKYTREIERLKTRIAEQDETIRLLKNREEELKGDLDSAAKHYTELKNKNGMLTETTNELTKQLKTSLEDYNIARRKKREIQRKYDRAMGWIDKTRGVQPGDTCQSDQWAESVGHHRV